jgi:multidrug transporter EmrE-like cation transporter
MLSRLLLAGGTSVCFVTGGMLMKPSAGLARIAPTLAVIVCFAIGAALNIMLIHRGGEVGVGYTIVVGAETVLVTALAWRFYGEQLTPMKLVAVGLVLAGITLLAVSSAGSTHSAGSASPSEDITQLVTTGDAELGVDALHVRVDGPLRHHELSGDVVAGATGDDPFGDLHLAR